MFHFAPANSIEFLSASSQIFGVLLGLLGLSFVCVAEARERNVANLLGALTGDIIEEFKLMEQATGKDIDVHIDSPEGLISLLEEYKPRIRPERYKRMRAQSEHFLTETLEMRAISKKFRLNCWLSAALILLSVLGLLLPSDFFESDMGLIIVALLVLEAVALWQAVQFFLLIANTKAFFAYGSKS